MSRDGEERIPLLQAEHTTENSTLKCVELESTSASSHRKCCKCAIFVNRMDGGYSWCITTASFFVQLYVLGFMNNVSSLNGLWVTEFNTTPGIISWIGSINMGMMFLSAPLTALMDKKLGCQATGTIGCVLSIAGLLIASVSTNIVVLMLSYGLLFGWGASCCFLSSILIQAKYFNKRLALSNGIVTAGSGVGTLLISAFATSFYGTFGWRNGIRYYSIGYLLLGVLKMLYNDLVVEMKLCVPKKKQFKRDQLSIDPAIWMRATATDLCPLYLLKNIPFLIFNVSCIFFMIGYFVPYIHLVFYAENKGINHDQANLLIGYLAISSLCGKLLTGKIAELPFMSPLYIMIGSFAAIGFSHIGATMMKSYGQFVAYSVMFGLFDGSYACLVTVVVCDLIGREELGSGIGLLLGIKAIPLMLGGPFAGFLFDYFHSYFTPFLVSGVIVFVAMFIMFLIPFYKYYVGRNTNRYVSIPFNNNPESNTEGRHMAAFNSRMSEEPIDKSNLTTDDGLDAIQPTRNPKSNSYSEYIPTRVDVSVDTNEQVSLNHDTAIAKNEFYSVDPTDSNN